MRRPSFGILAIIAVIVILAGITIYSGEWPPASVVESESMQHSSNWTWGTINTGDIVLVKYTGNPAQTVNTYVTGRESNYSTYGEYGNVILYNDPNGNTVIHRAMFYLSWDNGTPVVTGYENQTWLRIVNDNVIIYNCGYTHRNLIVDVSHYENQDGFITVGDHNLAVSQLFNRTFDAYYAADQNIGIAPGPITEGQIVGVAVGQLPWFGLIKLNILRLEGNWNYNSEVPAHSYEYLGLSLFLILVVIFFPYSKVAKQLKRK